MEIDLLKLSERKIESTTESKEMRLSEHAKSMVFQMFTKNVYSNPIGTIVREITSNCFDSHVEAKVNSPVLIKHFVDNSTETHYVSFVDYGMGMSKDRIDNIYSVYFESSKRVDNTQIGGFGIGGKTPLAYKRNTGLGQAEYDNSFYVITTYESMKYYYMIYEGEKAPIVSLLHEEETTDHNGTEVRIPVLEKDLNKFANEITKQLYYFENLVFEGFENYTTITNEYKIVKAKTFLFRGNDLGTAMHICLGRVAYPIDYSALGLYSRDYALPFALKLEVGDINPTVSRESIDYSEQTIELLKRKLNEVVDEMKEIVRSKYDNIKTLEDYFQFKDKYGYYHFDGIETSVNVRDIIDFHKLDLTNFKFNFMKMPNFSQLFNLFFKSKDYGEKKTRYNKHNNNSTNYSIINDKAVYYCPNGFNRKVIKQAYLADIHNGYRIVTKKDDIFESEISQIFNVSETALFTYANTLDDNGNKTGLSMSGLTDFAKEILNLKDEMSLILEKHLPDYEDIVVSEEFILERKNRRQKINYNGVNFSVSSFNTNYLYFDSKYRVEFSILKRFKGKIYYCTSEDENVLKTYAIIFKQLFPKVNVQSISYSGGIDDTHSYGYYSNNPKDMIKKAKILFIKIAKSNLKYMNGLDNAKPIQDIVLDLFYRKFDQLESFLTYEKVFNAYNNLSSSYKHENISLISPLLHRKMVLIKKQIEIFKLKTGGAEIDFINFTNMVVFKDLAKIKNVKVDKNVAKLEKRIDDMKAIEAKNKEILEYVNISIKDIHRYDTEIQVEILKKLMEFK